MAHQKPDKRAVVLLVPSTISYNELHRALHSWRFRQNVTRTVMTLNSGIPLKHSDPCHLGAVVITLNSQVCIWSGQRPTPDIQLGPHAAAAKAYGAVMGVQHHDTA